MSLQNVGVGVADIRAVRALVDGEPAGEAAFQAAVMSPRMQAWAERRDGEDVGYLSPRQSAEPISWTIANPLQARVGDYLGGQFGPPMAGADVEVCYCSVHATCWTVRHLDREPPERVRSCGVDGAPEDAFADWRETRGQARSQDAQPR